MFKPGDIISKTLSTDRFSSLNYSFSLVLKSTQILYVSKDNILGFEPKFLYCVLQNNKKVNFELKQSDHKLFNVLK